MACSAWAKATPASPARRQLRGHRVTPALLLTCGPDLPAKAARAGRPVEPFNAARALEAVRAATAGRGAAGYPFAYPYPGAAPGAAAQGGAPGGAQAQREVQMRAGAAGCAGSAGGLSHSGVCITAPIGVSYAIAGSLIGEQSWSLAVPVHVIEEHVLLATGALREFHVNAMELVCRA